MPSLGMKTMDSCMFCSENFRLARTIYENQFFYAIFDMSPVSPGHSLVIPKTHRVSLLDLNVQEWISLQNALLDVVKVIE